MNQTYVLDASAVLNWLTGETGSGRIDQLLRDADRSRTPLLASVANWGEIFYLFWQRHGEQSARETLGDLSRLPIQVVPVDLAQALKAGELKALHKIPYVDCIAAALAILQHATLVTSDRDFEKLGRHFPILWLARP
jgi:predicted nucleic acid-binding protein